LNFEGFLTSFHGEKKKEKFFIEKKRFFERNICKAHLRPLEKKAFIIIFLFFCMFAVVGRMKARRIERE
jgi:hypothetical protein